MKKNLIINKKYLENLKILNENENDIFDIYIDLKDSVAKELGLIKFTSNNYLVNYSDRIVVLKKINDKNLIIPFYISTGNGGKKNVPVGEWYPFLGIASDNSWLIKIGENSINNGYFLKDFQDTIKILNSKLGDLRNKSIPKSYSFDFSKNVNQSFKHKVNNREDVLGLIIRLFEIFKRYKDDNKAIEKKIKEMLIFDGFSKTEIEKNFNELNIKYPHLIEFKEELIEKKINLEKDFFKNKDRDDLTNKFIGFIKQYKEEFKLKNFKIIFSFSNFQITLEVKQTLKESKYRLYYNNDPNNKIYQDSFSFINKTILIKISSYIIDYFAKNLNLN